MSKILSLGISSCPNDTFIFDAWVNGKLGDFAPQVRCYLEDISTLNQMAIKRKLDVCKVSFYAYGLLMDNYTLINAGGALGRGCGPLIVARSKRWNRKTLAGPGATVAVPGSLTTANLLLSLYQPKIKNKISMKFEQIIPAIVKGEVDAGVIIHEGRFTYEKYGLIMVDDLGVWWEKTTNYPIPLGAIIARRSLGEKKVAEVEAMIRRSLIFAFSNPNAPLEFMKQHAGEMDIEVMRKHVELYVNNYSLDYGKDGMEAINYLIECADEKGLLEG